MNSKYEGVYLELPFVYTTSAQCKISELPFFVISQLVNATLGAVPIRPMEMVEIQMIGCISRFDQELLEMYFILEG